MKSIVLFSFFIGLYAGILVAAPALGPTDDFIFLRTLEAGKPIFYYSADFPYFNSIEIGRFTPLGAMEYNLASLIPAPSPLRYYLPHVFELIVFAIVFVKILGFATARSNVRHLAVALFALTPGFVYVWFRLQLNERNLIVLLALFLLGYLNFLKRPGWPSGALAFLASTAAVFYKETGFIIVGAVAVIHLVLAWKSSSRKIKTLDLLLIGGALSYLTSYMVFVLPYGGIFSHGRSAEFWLVRLIKNIFNYSFISDPVMMFVILPLAGLRFYKIVLKKEKPEPLFDALLGSASLFVFSYFILNLHGPYYFLPAYVFGIPPLFYFSGKMWRHAMWKSLYAAAALFFVLNTIPTGIHYMTYYKYLPVNFNRALDFIVARVKAAENKPVRVYFDGMNRGSSGWNFFIASEFLRFKGLTETDFDISALREDEKVLPEKPLPLPVRKISLPFSVFRKTPLPHTASGDLLVVSPQSPDSVRNPNNKEHLTLLEGEYELLMKTESPLASPIFNLKEVARYFLSAGASPKSEFLGFSRKPPFQNTPDFYVYVHK